jgi:hypothetical protein
MQIFTKITDDKPGNNNGNSSAQRVARGVLNGGVKCVHVNLE